MNGTLPYEISQFSKLENLILQNNFLRGTIPEFLGNVSLLHTLILTGNLYEGTIPAMVLESSSLLGTIHLSKMNLTGSIPTTFGALPMVDLRLDENRFSGEVPSELGSVSEMRKYFDGSMWLGYASRRAVPLKSSVTSFYLSRRHSRIAIQ